MCAAGPGLDGLAGGDQRRGRQRVFPFRMPNLRVAADERELGTHLRGVPLRARSLAVYENAVVRAILLLKLEQIERLGDGLRTGWPKW